MGHFQYHLSCSSNGLVAVTLVRCSSHQHPLTISRLPAQLLEEPGRIVHAAYCDESLVARVSSFDLNLTPLRGVGVPQVREPVDCSFSTFAADKNI